VLGSLIHLDVRNEHLLRVQVLRVRIALSILQKIQKETARLLRPSALRNTILLGLGVSAHASLVHAERNGVLVSQHVPQVLLRLAESHAFDCSSSLPRVLVMHSQSRSPGSRSGGRVDLHGVLAHDYAL